jgi:DNA topoisomerase-1
MRESSSHHNHTSPAPPSASPSSPPAEVLDDVRAASLRYVSDQQPGLRRRKNGKGFTYTNDCGETCRDPVVLERIRTLAIPPAWNDVWICARANGHIQATGRDAKGRKQYRYHPDFREARDSTKYEHMIAFAHALPAIRAQIAADMARPGLAREKVLATIVHLLETTHIRVGNEDYAKENKSYGLTTLRNPHVQVNGTALRFNFKGKGGKVWRLQIRDRRVAKVIRACQDLPGQQLFQYFDETGTVQDVTSSDVNAYLREITGADITAKDFRTWTGTVLAAMTLQEYEKIDNDAKTKKNIRAAIEQVAARLGNTVTICRKCYVHPDIIQAYLTGSLTEELAGKTAGKAKAKLRHELKGLKHEEVTVLKLLEKRRSSQSSLAETVKKLGLVSKTVDRDHGKPNALPARKMVERLCRP